MLSKTLKAGYGIFAHSRPDKIGTPRILPLDYFIYERCRNIGKINPLKHHTLPLLLICFFSAVILLLCSAGLTYAADIKVSPSATRVSPGENFYIDIVVENIPSEGLGAIQFRLNVDAPGSEIVGVSNTAQAGAGDISVVTPLIIGPPTSGRSGIGEFFWNATGPHGILVMDNENLKNGNGLYTFGHTNGSTPPSGSGSVSRFYFAVGKDVAAEKIFITLSEVMLLDAGTVYPLESNIGAIIELRCITKVPDLLGLSQYDAQAALQKAGLLTGKIYEIDNTSGNYALNKVLAQSYAADTSVLCETPVDLAINTAPSEVSNANAVDKANDERGAVILSWIPSSSPDTAGYRVYLVSGLQSLLREIKDPASTGVEITGLTNGQVLQLKITAFDNFGNESQGVIISATPVDDVAPRITVSGVSEGAFYSSDVLPVIDVQDANLSTKEITLNNIPYNMAAISLEGNYILMVRATDASGNSTTKEIRFVIDKTPPVISVTGIEKDRYYNVDVSPVITVTDSNLQRVESFLNGNPYTSGSTITTEGTYQLKIEAADKAGNSSSDTYIFYIDKTKPTSSIAIGEPKLESNGSIFVTGSTSFTLTGKDEGSVVSGLDRLEYRLNSSEWNIYQSPFTLTGLVDGVITVDYRAVDIAGNIEDYHTLIVKADNTPPVTTISVGDPKYTNAGATYVTKDTAFTLSATDNLSGVSKTEYKIDDGEWSIYVPFKINTEGSHTISYRSKDNLGNLETEKTLTVILDNTPPVTAISIDDPKYTSSDGMLYVTGNTTFTLSSMDTLSGVANTQYRVDGGAWTIYAPFSVPLEGSHTIEYRSIDNVGNAETEGTLAVIIDNTPPVTTISVGNSKYTAAGTLYVTGNTIFTLNATDNLSGVAKTEYKIDGGAWTIYAPFTAPSEGMHTIGYRSIDNVTNVETEKTLAIIVDNTPPVTAMTASDPLKEGVINTVAPRTKFTLSAADNLSGVKEIRLRYSIDGGAWQTYMANFSLSGLAAGMHAIAYKATDNVLNEETEKAITLTLIVIDVSKNIAVEPAVLVGVWANNNSTDLEQKQADINTLNAILTTLHINYYMAPSTDEFEAALRSGRYNTYLLVDFKEPLVGEEIREAVNYGDGLIFIKTLPDADPFLDDVFGVKFTGKTTSSDLTVNLIESPISTGETIQCRGKNVVATITSDTAQGFGYVMDKHNTYPSIVSNQYERGRTILYNFDLLYGTGQSQAAALISNSLNYVAPQEYSPRALSSAPIRISLKNSTEPVDVKVTEAIPYGTTVDTISPYGTLIENTITWQKSLDANEKALFGYYLNLPDTSGDYITNTELQYSNNGYYRLYGNYTLTLNIQNAAELQQKTITELRTISTNNIADADRITKALENLLAINVNALNKKEAEQNIRLIVKASDEVRRLSFDASEIRLKLNELLKIWEMKWYLMKQ